MVEGLCWSNTVSWPEHVVKALQSFEISMPSQDREKQFVAIGIKSQ
jgi:hypothetical protein